MEQREIKNTGVKVTPICFGTSSLGDMPDTYGYDVSEAQAIETLIEIFQGPVNFIDTSNNYGFGRSETRIGKALNAIGGVPEGFVIATKVDRDMETGRFDAARVRQSLEESLDRLGMDRVDVLHLHDPEHARDLAEMTCDGGAFDEVFKLKEQGLIKAVGLAMGRIDMMFPLLKSYPFDTLISHNRFSLLNRCASEMFDYAHNQGMAILNAAPFAGGVLAKGSKASPSITYQDATEDMLAPVKQIEHLCENHNVPMGAAALQFSLNDPRITSTLVGVSKPERVAQTLEWAKFPLSNAMTVALQSMPYDTTDPEANRAYKPG